MNYGLALVTEYHDGENIGISIGCESINPGMMIPETDTKAVIGEYWFDTARDRQACISYADAMCKAMSRLYSLSPDGVKMCFGGNE